MADTLRLPTAEEVAKIEAAARSMIPWDTGDGHLAIWVSAAICFIVAVSTAGYIVGGIAVLLIYKPLVWLMTDRTERDPEEVRAKLSVEDWTWQPSVDWEAPVVTETTRRRTGGGRHLG